MWNRCEILTETRSGRDHWFGQYNALIHSPYVTIELCNIVHFIVLTSLSVQICNIIHRISNYMLLLISV